MEATEENHNLPSHYVGIGASAGGLEAIEAFFETMPVDSGLALIIIQHLSPDYKSLMAELLSKRTSMPVCRAEEGMEVLANHVYLIPPKKNLRIFHGKLILNDQDHRHGPNQGLNLPVDIFFRSLAEDQGEKSIGVILSGTGSDGTRGISAIKGAGGMVVVQDPETARFDGMPRNAIATGLADFVLPPQEMATQIQSYSIHPFINKSTGGKTITNDEDGLSRIFVLLRESCKVDFTFYKPNTMIRRIERRMSIHQIHELQDYVAYMEENPVEVTALYRELLIGVTNFFRDNEAFDELRHKFLPELFQRSNQLELRLWVAGCSTGEEAYSLAILCREIMDKTGSAQNVRIFATDVDREAIEHASIGVYPESIAADMPGYVLNKYFLRQGDMLQISRQIRQMVVFAHHNLIKDPPFTNIDLVSCRNLLIYLQPILQRKALEYFNFSLKPQGLLFLGSSETVGEMADFFRPLQQKWRIYEGRGKRHMTGMLREPMIAAQAVRTLTPLGRRTGAWRAHEEERALDRLLQGLSGDLLPLVLLVNEHLELLHVVGEAHPFLRFPSGKSVNDLSKCIADELVIPLTTGMLKVCKQEQDISFSNIRVPAGTETILVNMRMRRLPQRKGQEPLIAVIIDPAAKVPCVLTDGKGEHYDLDKEAEQRIGDLEQELQFTRENLQATIEELETSNEELQATNEELLASNEELQSTNEELQSVNEELFTVNSEYQSKINELTQVNNDYDNLLYSLEMPIMFLDENKKVRRISPPLTALLGISDNDLERPFIVRNPRFANLDLEGMIDEVLLKQRRIELEIRDNTGHWYLLRLMPYRVGGDVYSGVVLLFIDIQHTKEGDEALRWNQAQNNFLTKSVGLGIWDWDIASGKMQWTASIEPLFGMEAGCFGGTYDDFLQCIHPDDRSLVEGEIKAALAGQRPYRLIHRVIWPDGSIHHVEESGQVYTDSDGASFRMMGMIRGMDMEKTALRMLEEKAIRLQETHQLLTTMQREVSRRDQMFREFLQLMPVAVGLARDTIIEWGNNQLTELLGYEPEVLRGREICALLTPCKEGKTFCLELLREARLDSVITDLRHRNGQQVCCTMTTVPIDPGDPEAGIVFVLNQTAGNH
ncbi:MAG TPA: chemotaxis protein CheR [Desulfobulbaceae bacterium]|nr:MAG: chemotaxis protein CheR [Deltaproteobacteria bacterium RIFOXYD12_FULL_53_23]HCC53785.1 chemotaxis protein CheR [Desulfobulbaceae bacterium]